MHNRTVRDDAKQLRCKGKTYLEIRNILKIAVPKSTMSSWFRGLKLSQAAKTRITWLQLKGLESGRRASLLQKTEKRFAREKEFLQRNQILCERLKEDGLIQKAVLATLYLAEGSKSKRGSLMFGNSDPEIIKLFLGLLRACFNINETRFRVTIQCRADQNVNSLRLFWTRCTGIPLRNFYKAQIDRRTIGKPTQKREYKGVCRIDYFASIVDLELKSLAKQMERVQYKRCALGR